MPLANIIRIEYFKDIQIIFEVYSSNPILHVLPWMCDAVERWSTKLYK